MANTLTVKTNYAAGVTAFSEGFTPIVKKRLDASELGIAANAVVVALKVPEGSVLRSVVIDVKTAGVAQSTVKVGTHIGALTAGATDSDAFSGSGTNLALDALGKTVYTVAIASRAVAAADTYIVLEFDAAQSAAVLDVIAIADIFDVASVTN